MEKNYKNIWLVFVQIVAEEGFLFEDLIDSDEQVAEKYDGAWANLIVKADKINDAIEIVPQGLKEKNFEVEFIDKVENVQSLVEDNEIDNKVLEEINWLLSTEYVFMISDKIFPYSEENA